jgi:hypothetical protein
VVKQACGHWDWMSTFAEAAGLPAPAASDGVSLIPSLTGRGTQRPGTVYIEYFQNQATPNFADFSPKHRGRKRGQMQNVLLGGYMGVRYSMKSADDDFEIYNLDKDPQENDDLGKNPQNAALQSAMKARVLQLRVPDSSAPRPYDSALVPPVPKTPGGTPGLSWSLFQGDWPWVPDFRALAPAKRGATKTIDLAMAPGGQPFGVAFEGFFQAAQPGEYTFTIESDTGATLFLHDIRVVGEPRKNPAGKFSGSVRLNAGWHPIRLYYRHAGAAKPSVQLTAKHAESGEYKLSPDVFSSMAKT